MEAKELRIGNLISANYVYEGQVKTFERFNDTLNFVFFSDGNPNGIGEYLYNCQPIPLTEGWLLDFGFEKKVYESDIYNGVEYNLELNGLILNYSYDFSLTIHLEEKDFGFLPDLNLFKNVHQLQNLYFALTGEELTIKNQN